MVQQLHRGVKMLNIKCFHCGKSFALDEGLTSAWLEEHRDDRPKHYPAQCHFCRRVIKVPIRQIEQHMTRQEPQQKEQPPE
jgi:phage terminase large subunit GpA-like protein